MSNIAIMYGYGFDDPKNTLIEDNIKEFIPEGMELQTGYSVSCYTPTAFMVGVKLQDICMFSPVELQNTLTLEAKSLVDNWKSPRS